MNNDELIDYCERCKKDTTELIEIDGQMVCEKCRLEIEDIYDKIIKEARSKCEGCGTKEDLNQYLYAGDEYTFCEGCYLKWSMGDI